MITEIQKGKGIEGLVGHAPKVEKERQLDAVGLNFKPLYDLFEEILRDEEIMYVPTDNITEVLKPIEINAFLQTMDYEGDEGGEFNLGYFIGALIQNSYDAGYNGFTLNTPYKIHNICNGIQGKRRPISIEIYGNAGYDCGRSTRCVDFRLHGDAGMRLGLGAQYATFTLHGKLTGGYPNCGSDAKRSRFKTTDDRTLRQMVIHVARGNRVIFIKDGKEEVVRDYDGN